jgi:hypothetical protein
VFLVSGCNPLIITTPHHAEGLVKPKLSARAKKVTDIVYPRACKFKLKIGFRSLLYQLFSKRDLNSINVAKIDRFSNFLGRGEH